MNETPETDEAAGDLTGILLGAAFETKCRQLEMERNALRDALQQNQTMSQPLRTAYSRKELSEALTEWMVKQWGNSPKNLPPCLQDKYYRDNGLIYHFIADHFPTEKKQP